MLDDPQPARDGAFDEQLSLPAHVFPVPQLIENIVKRDGRIVPFDTRKIADAVNRAAESIGDGDPDLSRSLASAVAIYLNKNEDTSTLAVDKVHDAVERVLVEMGHLRTALAYVRYRDRRNHMRSLRDGADPHTILRELAEARRLREVHTAGPGLLIRTGSDTLAQWDAEKISEALVRETGLDLEKAREIAAEVEDQTLNAKIRTLTASLVRELVDAKLIEHGLEAYRARHMRLGVPLYDAEQIICAPDINESSNGQNPEATNRVLAGRVKKEFALGRVYPSEVADAHLAGEIHVHALTSVDRIDSLVQPLATIIKAGSVSARGSRRSRPPERPETLAAQMAGFTTTLQHHCSGPVAWDSVNNYFAPFIEDIHEDDYTDFANAFLYELAFRELTHSGGAPPTEIGLSWSVPDYLCVEPALGAGGKTTGRLYGDYLPAARNFATALLHAYGRILAVPGAAPLPRLELVLPRYQDREELSPFVRPAAEIAIVSDRIRFKFSEDAPLLPHTENIHEPREIVAHRVTLNLPRIGYRAKTEAAAFEQIDECVDLAVRAHLEKRAFLKRLFSLKDAGPLALFSVGRSGLPAVDIDRALYVVGLCGLNECVQAILGKELGDSDEAADFAEALLTRVRNRCAGWSESEHISLVTGAAAGSDTGRRFAETDLVRYPDAAAKVVKNVGPIFEARYTLGTELNAPKDFSPKEHLRIQDRFHPLLDRDAEVRLPAPSHDADPAEITDLILYAACETSVRALSFGR